MPAPLGRRPVLALLAATALPAPAARAQVANYWPDRPIRLVVPVAPGGPVDQQARLRAQRLTDRLGKPVVVYSAKPGSLAKRLRNIMKLTGICAAIVVGSPMWGGNGAAELPRRRRHQKIQGLPAI